MYFSPQMWHPSIVLKCCSSTSVITNGLLKCFLNRQRFHLYKCKCLYYICHHSNILPYIHNHSLRESGRLLCMISYSSHSPSLHLISFNNKRFKEFISDIYPKELTISETTESTSVASYLDLLFTPDRSNNITTKLYDKRDAFGFRIVNFPFMSSNIPSAPAYGVYASQLVRYARCCSNYSDFLIRHRALVKRLLSQGYKVNRLSNTFKKFYGRHTDLVGQYKKNVCQMFADSIS